MRTQGRIWLLLLWTLAAPGVLWAQQPEPVIELPRVQWIDANGKVIPVGPPLQLRFQSSVPADQLQARIFKKSKQELIKTGTGPNLKGCAIYSSVVAKAMSSSPGKQTSVQDPDAHLFSWYLDCGSLNLRTDGGYDDQAYTIVLEKHTSEQVYTLQLAPGDDVQTYFGSGLEIRVSADGCREAGSWQRVYQAAASQVSSRSEQVVASVRKIEAGVGTELETAVEAATGVRGAGGSFGRFTMASPRPPIPTCVRVRTLPGPGVGETRSEEVVAALVSEPCLFAGQPLPFHLPTAALRSAWVLR